MDIEKQVDKSHYDFESYMTLTRWSSTWYQVRECLALRPKRVLEIGPGRGLFKATMALYGVPVETVDVDPALKPDHVASCLHLPFENDSYDVVCAFQMLEHLPFERSVAAFSEMARVARSHVLISLPNARKLWRSLVYVPRFGALQFQIPKPQFRAPVHSFDGEHYWEIGKRGYEFALVADQFSSAADVTLVKDFRCDENTYHHFLLFASNRARSQVPVK